MESNQIVKRYKTRQRIIDVLPLFALVLLFGLFCAVVQAKGYRLDMYLRIIFNEGIVLAVVATGAVFIYSLGSFDISLGASTLFSATLGVMTYNATQSLPLMILVIFTPLPVTTSPRSGFNAPNRILPSGCMPQ